jgi:putative endonuclease
MFSVYILYSLITDRYYVGQTSNLEDRLIRHRQGKNKNTKSGIPWKLVFKKSFESRSEAVFFEMKLKSSKSRKELQSYIESDENEVSSA